MLRATQEVPVSLVFLDLNPLSLGYQLPLEILDDQEILLVQGVPSCLHSLPLVDLGDQGDQVVQRTPFLHSGQGAPDPLEGL